MYGGDSWTPSDINSASFGTAIAITRSNTIGYNASIDSARITVSYLSPAGPIALFDNPNATDGASLTVNANDPAHGSDTTVSQTYTDTSRSFTNAVAAIPAGQDGEWDFSLYDNGAPTGTTYCFRVVYSGGLLLDTYSVIPQITTYSAAPTPTPTPTGPTMDQLMRGGKWFKDGILQPYSF